MTTHTPATPMNSDRDAAGRTEPPSTNFRWWRLCAWSGPVFLAGLTVFFAAVAGYLPPPREDWTAARVAEFYVDNQTRIMIGMEGCILFACLYFTWSLAVQRVMERSEGPDSPLPRIQTFGGAFTAWLITMFSVLFLVTAFRADERSSDDLRLLNDVAFFVFDMTVMFTFFQVAAFGIAVLRAERAYIPRWIGYLSFWEAGSFAALFLIPFLEDGPFAWHGLISFYLVFSLFEVWVIAVTWAVLRALRTIEAEHLAA